MKELQTLIRMVKNGLPKSMRKFIRREKARIRKSVLDIQEQQKLIAQLYERSDIKKLLERKQSSATT